MEASAHTRVPLSCPLNHLLLFAVSWALAMQVIIISQSWDIKYFSVYFGIWKFLVVFQWVQLSSLLIICLLEHLWCGTSFVSVASFSQYCTVLLSLAPWHMHATQPRKSGNRQDPGAQLSQFRKRACLKNECGQQGQHWPCYEYMYLQSRIHTLTHMYVCTANKQNDV